MDYEILLSKSKKYENNIKTLDENMKKMSEEIRKKSIENKKIIKKMNEINELNNDNEKKILEMEHKILLYDKLNLMYLQSILDKKNANEESIYLLRENEILRGKNIELKREIISLRNSLSEIANILNS